MRVAYLYNRDFSEGEAMGAEKTFADYTNTNREDLSEMIERKGIREGDVVCVRAVGDLGQGAESKRNQERIVELGATIEVCPGGESKKVTGRPARLEFATLEEWDRGCAWWYTVLPEKEALKRMGRIVGGEVDKNWAVYRCGNRSGKQQSEKREIMAARLKRKED